MESEEIIVSYFSTALTPCLKIPSAPKGKEYIHYPVKNVSFKILLQFIQSGYWEGMIDKIKKDNYSTNKKYLPCFTPSGVFRLRLDNDVISYSKVICLDFDKVDSVFNLKEVVKKDKHTLACFYSPSYKGLKVFIKVNSSLENHLMAFNQLSTYYEALTGIAPDQKCKNVSRLCFLSFDKDVYLSEHAETFNVLQSIEEKIYVPRLEKSQIDFENPNQKIQHNLIFENNNLNDKFNYLYQFTKNHPSFKTGYISSNRNNFIYAFGCNCNRYGIEELQANDFARIIWNTDPSNFPENELIRTVKSAYSNINEHGRFFIPKNLTS